jgi:[ribosomal protein S5]-alanine N-acetyltransferase
VVTVRIELIEERHAPAVQRLASDAAIAATSNVPHPYPDHGALMWIRHALDGRARGTLFAFAVVDGSGTLVGVCSLMGVSTKYRMAALGYWIGTSYWGRGYATEAARQVLDVGFDELSLDRVEAGALEHNIASNRVLQKLGFVRTGVRTSHEKGIGVTYTLDRDQWLRASGRDLI